MLKLNNKSILISLFVLLASTASYFLFFKPSLSNKSLISGLGSNDALSIHYPTRQYLYEKIVNEGVFPFWSEKILLGVPIYADTEKAYLSILNILSILIFGPINSYKILHYLVYLTGSISLYLLFKQLFIDKKIIYFWLTSNTIYYFSFFNLFKQQDFNALFVTYLIPSFILTIELFFKTKKYRYMVLNLLLFSFALRWGHYQFIILALITQSIYVLSMHLKKIDIKDLIMYFLLFLGLNSYVLYPAYNLFINHQSQNFNFTKGSYTLLTFISNLYPLPFGDINNYVGQKVDSNFYITEFYIYFGISTLAALLLGLFSKRSYKTYKFLVLSFLTFLLLGFLKYIPLINSLPIPILNSFSFWNRSWVIPLFGISLFVGEVFTYNENAKATISSKKLQLFSITLFILILLISLFKFNSLDYLAIKYINDMVVTSGDFFMYYFLFFIVSFTLFFIILFGNNKNKIHSNIFLGLLIIGDIMYFSLAIILPIYKPSSNVKLNYSRLNLENKRVIWIDDSDVYGNRTLLLNNWNLFGNVGLLEDSNFNNYLNTLRLDLSKSSIATDDELSNFESNFKHYYDNLGINGYVNFSGSYKEYNSKPNLIKDIQNIDYSKISEGHLIFSIYSEEPKIVNTTIRNYNGWELTINNTKRSLDNDNDDVFLKFKLDKGLNNIELKFIPKDLLLGFQISFVFLILSTIFYYINIKKEQVI